MLFNISIQYFYFYFNNMYICENITWKSFILTSYFKIVLHIFEVRVIYELDTFIQYLFDIFVLFIVST